MLMIMIMIIVIIVMMMIMMMMMMMTLTKSIIITWRNLQLFLLIMFRIYLSIQKYNFVSIFAATCN